MIQPGMIVLAVLCAFPLGGKEHQEKSVVKTGLPPGAPRMWQDRGDLTPAKVYWGIASGFPDPNSRRPAPPFSHLEPDEKPGTVNPKVRATDSKGVKWTLKFQLPENGEVHAEIAATRLAWALGFGVDEDYYVDAGKFESSISNKGLGKAAPYIQPDGSFQEARFKRHRKEASDVKDAKGKDRTWDEAHNPGVPPEHLSGLLIFDVLIHNFDAQPKNCRIVHTEGPHGPENWFIMSDMGASFGGRRSKGNLQAYQAERSYIKKVANGFVEMNFYSRIHSRAGIHRKIPLKHAQWFRRQLEKLTDDEIRAAFNAAYATGALDAAYTAGDLAQVKRLTSPTADAYTVKFREKIEEFKSKVPP